MAHQGGFPPNSYQGQEQPGYTESTSTEPVQPAGQSAGGGKKKRQYAGQAYELGANVPPAGGVPFSGPAAGGYGGYPAQTLAPTQGYQQPAHQHPGYQQPAYGGYATSPQPPQGEYGQQPLGAGGYQDNNSGYPAAPAAGGVGGISHGMSNMNMGAAPMPGQAQGQRSQLNQLYPTDLLNQGFTPDELDLPPPPIILPPNVRKTCAVARTMLTPSSVQCHTLAFRQLSAQVCAIHLERGTYYAFTIEEIQTAIRFSYPAVQLLTRLRRSCTYCARPVHCKM